MSGSREERGLEIAKHASISENEDGSFSVPSQTTQGVSYMVVAFGDAWTCTCPDFVNRAAEIDACKHVIATRLWIAARVELANQPKPRVFAEDAIQCDRCGSIRVIRYGKTPKKQVYWCKDCSHKFTPSLLKKARYTPEMITLTLDLYFSGVSLRKIARIVKDHFGQGVGKSSVYRWIQSFVPKVSEYVSGLSPQLSETWHADELFVKMKGGQTIKWKGDTVTNIAYVWNIMDGKTRFLLASRLSKSRDEPSALAAFNRAVRVAKGSEPKKVVSDALPAYYGAVRHAFKTSPTHIARAGVRKSHSNNNRIERLNGTLRERVKVQRGWKTLGTPLAEGARIQYNFVKPHEALGGQTPAERAGIGVFGENKWLSMLRGAVANQSGTGGQAN